MASGKAPRRSDDDERYPNLAARRDLDRAEHIRRGIAAGLTRKQAERHADDEVGED